MIVSFQNNGEIDMRAVTTIGISAKEGDSPIGYFGSGLKYAISVILRSGGSITVWSGLHRYVFAKAPVRVRDQDFEVITMTEYGPSCEVGREPRELGFTTRLGVNWEGWQAFREIYCNAIDEKGEVIMSREGHTPSEGKTTIHVSGVVDFEESYNKRGAIVLTREPAFRLQGVDVHLGESQHIYYRGILAGELDRPSAFCYNILTPLVLTEDRTIKHIHYAHHAIARAIVQAEDEEFLEGALHAPREGFEHRLDLGVGAEMVTPSVKFLDMAEAALRSVEKPHNLALMGLLAKHRKSEVALKPAVLTAEEERQFVAAKEIVRSLGYDIDAHPIVVVPSLGVGILGRVQGKMILVSRRAFDMGTKTVAGTLMEELLHLGYGFLDCSRDFQNYLIDRLVTLAVSGPSAVGAGAITPPPGAIARAIGTDEEPF